MDARGCNTTSGSQYENFYFRLGPFPRFYASLPPVTSRVYIHSPSLFLSLPCFRVSHNWPGDSVANVDDHDETLSGSVWNTSFCIYPGPTPLRNLSLSLSFSLRAPRTHIFLSFFFSLYTLPPPLAPCKRVPLFFCTSLLEFHRVESQFSFLYSRFILFILFLLVVSCVTLTLSADRLTNVCGKEHITLAAHDF